MPRHRTSSTPVMLGPDPTHVQELYLRHIGLGQRIVG